MKGFVYILKCANGSYYTGSPTNLEKRLWQHKNGEGAKFTKAHLPIELVYTEEFSRIEDAFYREKQIQGWSRKKKEALISGNFNALHKLAECKNASLASAPLSNRSDYNSWSVSAVEPSTRASGGEPVEPCNRDLVGERSRTEKTFPERSRRDHWEIVK